MFHTAVYDALVPTKKELGYFSLGSILYYADKEYLNGKELYGKAALLLDWKNRGVISNLGLTGDSIKQLLNLTDDDYNKIVSALFEQEALSN